eukprot:1156940-Pelagomonas_calceolata.AAC.1
MCAPQPPNLHSACLQRLELCIEFTICPWTSTSTRTCQSLHVPLTALTFTARASSALIFAFDSPSCARTSSSARARPSAASSCACTPSSSSILAWASSSSVLSSSSSSILAWASSSCVRSASSSSLLQAWALEMACCGCTAHAPMVCGFISAVDADASACRGVLER